LSLAWTTVSPFVPVAVPLLISHAIVSIETPFASKSASGTLVCTAGEQGEGTAMRL